MLTHQEHLAQAVHNENAAKFLKATPVVDWAATAVFYSALHYVDAYISKGSPKAEFRHHGARETVFEGDPLLFSVYSDYKDLKSASMEARYKARKHTTEYVDSVLLPKLHRIRATLAPHM